MAGVEDFSFGDDNLNTGGGFKKADPKLKFKKGEKARLSLAWWATDESGVPQINPGARPRLRKATRHFFDKIGYIIRPDVKGSEYDKLAGEDPKTVFATVVVRWPMTPAGAVDTSHLSDYRAYVWTPPKTVIDQINMAIKQEVDIATQDLFLECTDEQFQKMTVTLVPKNLLKGIQTAQPALFRNIVDQINARVDDISYHVGREMDLDALKEKLGLGGPTPQHSAQATQQVDPDALSGMLDNELDGLL